MPQSRGENGVDGNITISTIKVQLIADPNVPMLFAVYLFQRHNVLAGRTNFHPVFFLVVDLSASLVAAAALPIFVGDIAFAYILLF
ncbi:MAG: hypothetical protein KJO26_02830 [Deltaproteobacteria bacterium]|nr:hypothetical protein [Deltaproteobacteria bacterium]